MQAEKREAAERPLRGRVAIVTGASRGAGRGIAAELGAAGATVYVTGRSTRGEPARGYKGILGEMELDGCRAPSTKPPRR